MTSYTYSQSPYLLSQKSSSGYEYIVSSKLNQYAGLFWNSTNQLSLSPIPSPGSLTYTNFYPNYLVLSQLPTKTDIKQNSIRTHPLILAALLQLVNTKLMQGSFNYNHSLGNNAIRGILYTRTTPIPPYASPLTLRHSYPTQELLIDFPSNSSAKFQLYNQSTSPDLLDWKITLVVPGPTGHKLFRTIKTLYNHPYYKELRHQALPPSLQLSSIPILTSSHSTHVNITLVPTSVSGYDTCSVFLM